MNILPKKRWHVRTKDNIARVRCDEAKAKEQERSRLEKLSFSESEARINLLRKKSGVSETVGAVPKFSAAEVKNKHIELFADYKFHTKTTNKDFENEKKDQQEKYEKQIGYLTYLGQDTNESLKLKSWYEISPKRSVVDKINISENDSKRKHCHDPLTLMNDLLSEKKVKLDCKNYLCIENKEISSTSVIETKHTKISGNHKNKSQKDKNKNKNKKLNLKAKKQEEKDKLEKLRHERLCREANERLRQEAILAPKLHASPKGVEPIVIPRIIQKYNSQFNPKLAKQNML